MAYEKHQAMHATVCGPIPVRYMSLTVAFPSHGCRITWNGRARFTILSGPVVVEEFTVYGISGPIEATAAMWHYLAQSDYKHCE